MKHFSIEKLAPGILPPEVMVPYHLGGVARTCNLGSYITAAPRSYPLDRENFGFFSDFSAFPHVFQSFRKRLDQFGPVRMRSDVFGCVQKQFRRVWTCSGKSQNFDVFRKKSNPFWTFGVVFQSRGLTFTCFLRLGGLTFIGAYFSESALHITQF